MTYRMRGGWGVGDLDGKVSYDRTSASKSPLAHEAPEGTIDPWLKTLSFWDGDKPLRSCLLCESRVPEIGGIG